MPGKLRWFEREFDFDFPAARYPDIIERLRGTPVRIEEMIGSFPTEILTQRLDGTWSIQENVGHLLDLEPLWFGRLEDILAGTEAMREADLTNRATHEADHNAASMAGLMESFRVQRQAFVTRLDQLDPQAFSRAAIHPRLGQPMRLVDLCLFTADHDDYHLARMTELAGT